MSGVVLKRNLESIEKICLFVREHGKSPQKGATDPHERTMYHKLQSLKQAKSPCLSTIHRQQKFYPQYQEKADQLGVPNLFDKKTYFRSEEDTIRELKEICAFFKANGRAPSHDTYDKKEEILSNLLTSLKIARNNKSNRFSPTYQQLAEDEGCPRIFEPIRTKANQVNKHMSTIENICAFHQTHGRFPSSHAGTIERKLDGRLQFFRRMKLRKLPHPLPSLYQKKATALGYPNLFASKTIEEKRKVILKRIKEMCKFYKKRGRFPLSQSKEECALGHLLTILRQGKRKTEGKTRKTDFIFDPRYQEMAEKCGVPELFDAQFSQPLRKYSYNKLVKRHNELRDGTRRIDIKQVASHRKEYDPNDFNHLREIYAQNT